MTCARDFAGVAREAFIVPLLFLCRKCSPGAARQECERILKSDVAVDVKDEFGNTPLIVACQNGKKRLAKLFLRYKANIKEVNLQGNTVLHYCFTYGYGDLGDYLISKGADPKIVNKNGLTCYEGLDVVRQASARSSKKR